MEWYTSLQDAERASERLSLACKFGTRYRCNLASCPIARHRSSNFVHAMALTSAILELWYRVETRRPSVTMASEATAYAPKHDGVVSSAEEEGVPTFTNSHRIDNADFVTSNETQDLKRGLSQRHISLIAIAGAIVSLGSM